MLKAGMLDRDYEREIEERYARGLVFALTGQDIAPERLDAQGIPATHGKKPDFKFVLDGDQTCFVEFTRLLPPMLRQVEAFAEQHICDPVKGNLPGTFTLSFSIDSLARRGIPGGHAEAIVDDLRRRLHHDPSAVPQLFEPITGYAIRKIDDVGSRLIPWVVAEELPYDLAADDPRALLLRHDATRGVAFCTSLVDSARLANHPTANNPTDRPSSRPPRNSSRARRD